MLSGLLAVFQFLAGLIGLTQSLVKEHDDEQLRQQGRLEEVSAEQNQKALDVAIADEVDARPVPSDRHRILDGMRQPAD